jgi:hypothetical protein
VIILKNKYKIEQLNEGISLSESIDGIAYTATIKLVVTDELKKIGIVKGDSIEIIEDDFETKKPTSIFKGIVWEVSNKEKIKSHMTLTCKEKTIYLEECEDEYLFPAGMTATQRAMQYCKDWGIPRSNYFAGTGIILSKAVYRSSSIIDMMLKDLKETAQKGGNLFKFRMANGLELGPLGRNETVWKLETIAEDIESKSSLDGAVTQVKVLGKEEENKKTPVIGIYKKDTDKFGTIQKIVQDEKIKSAAEAKKRAENLFSTGEESVSVSGIDINTIRAGDKVSLNGVFLYAIDVIHDLGKPGKMDLNLGALEYIRRRFYSGDNF